MAPSQFLQARLDTHEWWLIPVATLEATAFVYDFVNHFYRGARAGPPTHI